MKVTFPHMGNAWIVIQALFNALDIEVVVPPQNSKRALDLGTKLSPESACLPFKINLGNYLEAAEQGADTIIITGGIGPCRFGYYGELERRLLCEAGYPYELVILEPPDGSMLGLARRIKYLAGKKNSWGRIIRAIGFAYRKSVVLDQIEDRVHKARPLLQGLMDVEKLYDEARQRLAQAMTDRSMADVLRWFGEQADIGLLMEDQKERPLRVGITGEIYTILDPFTSLDAEKTLGQLGVEVDRSIYLSGWVGQHVFQGLAGGYKPMKMYPKLAKPYLNHVVGGHGAETVGAAVKFAREGMDGIIQIFPLTCMPEIVAASILPKVQADYNIPVMTLVVDEQTGRAGMETRLEAFVDLLERQRLQGGIREDVFSNAGK